MVYDLLALFAVAFAATAVLLAVARREAVPAGDLGYQLYLLVVFKAYFVTAWRYGGQTLGMRAWGLRVEPAAGPLSWPRAMMRYWVAVLSWVPAGLGYWWMFMDRQRRSWPDLAARTRVTWRRAATTTR